ncbi:ABC transporter [Hydrogenophaga crassostreae]|uniref:Cyclolysin secretion/processing ATP-binding protein CyaB n=1 Tax=Hydrogenophaga crassostreae TaxID=1763535 RepID=A0A167GYY4_9BURK|nr:peptidase domain-containing ABC transporter [Hydrogenophaga crassostreae]AOW12858.1 ABC transporter [Hydrogenophaga crassostreae]OAD40046.1 ABC transporter [Hydrogenophaga crassostreae]
MTWTDRLSFGLGQTLPVILQTEAAECGLACLAMVLNHHGVATDLAALRSRHTVAMTGVTLATLTDIAQKEQLGTRGLRLELNELAQLRLPAILHWDLNHFVVLKSVSRDQVVVHDPAFGERRLTFAEVSRHFTGVALELWPNPGFARREEKTRVKLSQLIGQVSGFWTTLGQVLMLSLALEIFGLASPLFMQWVLDDVVVSRDTQLLTTLALGFGLLMIVQQATNLIRSWLLMVINTSIGLQWKSNVFAHMTRLPLSYFQNRHLGDIVSRAGSVDEIQSTLTSAFVEALFDGLLVILTLVLMFVYSPPLAWVAVIAVLLYLLMRLVWYRPLYAAFEETLVRDASQSSHFLESIRGMRAIQLFGRQNQRQGAWQTLMVSATNARLKVQKLQIIYGVVRGLLSGGMALLIVWLGAQQIIATELTVGMLTAFMAYRGQFEQRVIALIDKAIDLKMLRLHAERLADLVLTPASDQTERLGANDLIARGSGLALTHQESPTIAFEAVRYRYSDQGPWVLDGLNLSIPPGQVLAITGRSGCGKTTLINLLLGTYAPIEGSIKADDLPLAQIGINRWRQGVATVMQDDTLFAGSISDNIGFFDERPDFEWMTTCARMAALHDDIELMPMAYQTLVGDMGTVLSGGQKQRLLLARALYKRPHVLVLDEATSHLDVESEAKVNAAIASLNITRIVVAHRPETIRSAQRVVVLNQGRVQFDGEPSDYFESLGLPALTQR